MITVGLKKRRVTLFFRPIGSLSVFGALGAPLARQDFDEGVESQLPRRDGNPKGVGRSLEVALSVTLKLLMETTSSDDVSCIIRILPRLRMGRFNV